MPFWSFSAPALWCCPRACPRTPARCSPCPFLPAMPFWTRCIDLLMRNVPMPSAASKSRSSGVRPATSPSRSAPTSVRWTARCRIGSSMLASAARISSTVPDGALLRRLLGAVHRNRAFDEDAPLHGILERCPQQPVYLVDGRAGKKPLLLLFRVSSCFLPSIY